MVIKNLAALGAAFYPQKSLADERDRMMSAEDFFGRFKYHRKNTKSRYLNDAKHRKAVDGRRANVKRMQAIKRKGRTVFTVRKRIFQNPYPSKEMANRGFFYGKEV
jgi:hypothetical protein